jgi:hypothetical protein
MTVKELLLQEIETATEAQLALTLTFLQTLKQNTLMTSDRSEPIDHLANDPLFKLVGCIHSDIPDLADNHDYYIGQALYEEMRRNE